MNITSSRRGFLKGMAGVAALGAGGCFSCGCKDTGKIRLACVGVMGKGYSDWLPMLRSGLVKIVAFCDCDYRKRQEAQECLIRDGVDFDVYSVPFYTDYRRLIDDADKLGIQAMTVSTTDHTHAPIAVAAMKKGIHVYVQKPLVRTLWELDYFGKTAKENGVVVQMGNQGSSLNGFRRGVDVLQSGILGDVKEVHVWTNRPVWPQGKGAVEATKGAADKIPAGFNWNTWLATAEMRPFKGAYPQGKKGYDPWNLCHNVYHPFSWRGFFDFGCGAFGDMACHTMNLPFRGLELGVVTGAKLDMIEDRTDAAFPMKAIVKLTYAARESKVRPGVKLPEVELFWYEGCEKPSADKMPQVVAAMGKVPNTGCVVIGSKGILCSTNDYGGDSFIALKGEEKVKNIKEHEACKAIAQRTPYRTDSAVGKAAASGAAAVSADGQYIEFLDAINGVGPVFEATNSRCYSDVEYTIPIMEGILVGVAAQRVLEPGSSFKWDSAAQKFDNEKANAIIKPYIRKGFEF